MNSFSWLEVSISELVIMSHPSFNMYSCANIRVIRISRNVLRRRPHIWHGDKIQVKGSFLLCFGMIKGLQSRMSKSSGPIWYCTVLQYPDQEQYYHHHEVSLAFSSPAHSHALYRQIITSQHIVHKKRTRKPSIVHMRIFLLSTLPHPHFFPP